MNNKLGHYKVGDKIFFDKIEAILHANQNLKNIEWYFNDDLLNKTDWTNEPTTSLDDFYKMRAQQIRDQFDYVIMMCSGGADSTNAAYSFLNNGIKIDEIVAAAPMSGINQYNTNNKDNTAENVVSETFLAQMPLMNDFATKFPDIKLTLHDYFEDILEYKSDEWLYKSGDWIHPSCVARYSLEKFKHIKDLAEAGKRIAVVYGIDKPTLYKDLNEDIFMIINDLAVNVQRPPFATAYPNVEVVLFYWSPELPSMMVKQAHEVARWLYQPNNISALALLASSTKPLAFEQNRVRQSHWEKAVIPTIYPSTVRKVFQSHKPIRLFLANIDAWFYKLHGGTRVWEMIDSDFRNFIKGINPKYLQKNKMGFNIFRKTYKIGHVSKFDISKQLIITQDSLPI